MFLPGESQGQGACWAAVYGVAQSRTRLKRLSSSSSSSSSMYISIPDSSFIPPSLPSLMDLCLHDWLLLFSCLSHVRLFTTPWITTCQASLSFAISQSLLKLMSMESVMPSNHFILCHLLLLLPSVFSSTRVFSSESVLHIRRPKY